MMREKLSGMMKKREALPGKQGIGLYPGLCVSVCLGLAVAFGFPASSFASYGAEGSRVYDGAALFTDSEAADYEAAIEELRDSLAFDVVLVTTEDAEGKTGQEYADDFYDQGGFGEGSDYDGILFLIDMDNRELVFSTSGETMRIFTDGRVEDMLDHVYEGAADGDFAASAEAFLEDVEYYGKKGIPAGQYNYDQETGAVSRYKSIRWYEALLAFLVPGVVAGGACLNVKKQYAMEADERQVKGADMAYRANSYFSFQSVTDPLLDQNVVSRVIPRTTVTTGTRGGGRSGGSARRTTTHRSSSGRRHGGGSQCTDYGQQRKSHFLKGYDLK